MIKVNNKTNLHLFHLCRFLPQTLWDPLVQAAQGGLELIFQAEITDS